MAKDHATYVATPLPNDQSSRLFGARMIWPSSGRSPGGSAEVTGDRPEQRLLLRQVTRTARGDVNEDHIGRTMNVEIGLVVDQLFCVAFPDDLEAVVGRDVEGLDQRTVHPIGDRGDARGTFLSS